MKRWKFYSKILLLFFILANTFMVGCGTGSNSDSDSGSGTNPILINSISYLNLHGLNGYGDIIAASYTDVSNAGATTGFKETLLLFQQDPTKPDLLLDIGSVYLGIDTLYHNVSDISLNKEWVTVTMNFTDTVFNPEEGYIAVVSLTNSPFYSLDLLMIFPGISLDRALAKGNWLLVAADTSLSLYDISNLVAPSLKQSFNASSSSTSMVAVSNGFYVITQSGYAHIDLTNPNNIGYTEIANLDIKQSKKAYAIGNKLYIGGPSKYAGSSKVARIDITTVDTPIVELINDQINKKFGDFSFDGDTGFYIFTESKVSLYTESGGELKLSKSGNISISPYGVVSQFYAHKNRFYVASGGINIYKFP